uniref:Transcription factor EC n=1 Tax=Hemiscolopendra marginata TaxID=943146 RepID=A0A646QCR7_9MYRI
MNTTFMQESGIDLQYDLIPEEIINSLTGDVEFPASASYLNSQYYQLKSKPMGESPPTNLKQSAMTSRTNLKQQLMKQQLQDQEQRRRQQQMITASQQLTSHPHALQHQSNAIQVPNITSQDTPVEVPHQILQVHSKLENPTKYHVIESQKRQVLQYLHQNTGNHTVPSNRSLPTLTSANKINNNNNASGSMGGGTMTVSTSTALTGGGGTTNVSSSAPDSPQSVAQNSSAATSVSEMDDLLEFINFDSGMDTDSVSVLEASAIGALPSTVPNNMGLLDLFVTANSKSSSSCPADLPPDSTDMMPCVTDCDLRALAKDRQKKDNHNMIERRRRFNINDRIKELGTLLPKTNEQYYDIVRDVRQNKGTILRASVEFIRRLKRDAEKVKQIEERHKQLEQLNRKLLLRIQELELLVQQHGIPLSECTWQPAPADTIINTLIKQESGMYLNIKSEPKDRSSVSSPLDDLMDDDISAVNGDPMLSSPIMDSPQSSQSYDGTLSPDTMDLIQ